MSAQPPSGKGKQGGWGSFLSGAVAGLESRLDNMLADDDMNPAKAKGARNKTEGDTTEKTGAQVLAAKAEEEARASSRTRVNARLQERLAKVVANNRAQDGSRDRSRASVDGTSPADSPALKATASRASIDSRRSEPASEALATKSEEVEEEARAPRASGEEGAEQKIPGLSLADTPDLDSGRPSYDSASRPSLEESHQAGPEPDTSAHARPVQELEAELAQIQKDREEEAKQRQEEMHEHMERIDALQQKLQYLARQAADAAKEAKTETTAGSAERKVAERDEQIALLLEEGQTLSKTELRLQNTIKQLRTKRQEEEKDASELRKRLERAEKAQSDAIAARLKANAKVKEQDEKLKIVNKIEKDVDELRREKEQSHELIRDLRQKLADSLTRAEEAEKKAQTDKLEQEKRKTSDLMEQLDNAKIERKLLEDRLKTDLRDAKEAAAKAEERAKMKELEMNGEITNLETKLELMRSRTEEAGATGDSQAKLLRQIETLQTQYALARENWQGIEGSLNARLVALEKERDEISKREADVRKKAREINSKARRQEEEIEALLERTRSMEQDGQEQTTQLDKAQARAVQAETALSDTREDFERQRKLWNAEFQQRVEEEKTKIKLEFASNHVTPDASFLRAESPSLSMSMRKPSNQDLQVLNTSYAAPRRSPNNRAMSSDFFSNSHGSTDRPSPRWPSALLHSASSSYRTPDGTSPRQLSANSLSQLNGDRGIDATIEAEADIPALDTPATGTSSPRHRGSNAGVQSPVADLVSVSTINAGPSVQLVERMSAAVRRLESEKASLKDELSRLGGQRDEAREEVVRLMREAEGWKEKEERLKNLEGQLKEMEDKYDGALDVLGEKQEKCDELVQDVADLKDMLRSMAEERAGK